MRKGFISLVLVVAVTLGVAACGSSSSSTTTTSASPTSGSVNVATPDGQVSLSLNGQLLPGWPANFPIPPGATPSGSGSLGNSQQTGMIGVYSSTMTPQDAFNFYVNDPNLTTSNKKTIGVGSAFVGSLSLSGSYTGSVTVSNVGSSGTLIVIHLATGGAASS
jgi:hypothetical protein